ncbi:hydroxypyruvate isomerase family protein [Devosia naphthalenivorans]|uniref:hydroxypyruvate isomerase family protein n=1 Tax=Devosia naphthalenivorans TaxID=2082392 RepID=UPI000D3448A5|nr:TIM barrel protein [Devosia naphthalenivorans]
MSFRYSAHIGYLFGEMPLQARVDAAARNGFSAVEHPSPYAILAETMRDLLASAGVAYTQFGLRSGNAEAGEKGIGIFADRREEFKRSVAEAIAYARTIGVDKLHAMAGVLPEAQRLPGHWDCYVENLRFAAREAGQHGISIIIEAMSAQAVPDYYIDTPDRAVEAIEATGAPNIGLLLDIFHTASTGLDIEQIIRRHSSRILHVHIADAPGRHEPGSGQIDFDRVEAVLEEVGYGGLLGCEYSPADNTEAGLGWLQAKLA